MKLDPELEKLLESLKNDEPLGERPTTPIDLPPPKPRHTEPAEEEKKTAPSAPREAEQMVHKEETPIRQKPEKAARPPRPKKEKKGDKKRQKPAIVALAVLLILALAAGGFFAWQGAYIKRYEAKYNIHFPAGIPQELCDAYGQNQSLAGSLEIEGRELLIYSTEVSGGVLLERGSNFRTDQHYRAVALDKEDADLEALYFDAEDFKKASQRFSLKTVYGAKEQYQIIAAYIVNTKPEDDNGYAFPYNCYGNFTEKSYKHYQDTVKCRRLYDTGYKIAQDDYCLTLSVPTDIMPDFRFVVVGVKKEKPEKITAVKENPRIRYPQAYCDKLGIRNIYAQFSSKWYPEIIVNAKTNTTKQLTERDFE